MATFRAEVGLRGNEMRACHNVSTSKIEAYRSPSIIRIFVDRSIDHQALAKIQSAFTPPEREKKRGEGGVAKPLSPSKTPRQGPKRLIAMHKAGEAPVSTHAAAH